MNEVTVKHIDDMQAGEHAGPGRCLDLARGLGVSALDMQLIKLAPNDPEFPDAGGDGQEAVYIVLQGDAVLFTPDGNTSLDPSVFVRVGATVKRTIVPGDTGATILAIATRH